MFGVFFKGRPCEANLGSEHLYLKQKVAILITEYQNKQANAMLAMFVLKFNMFALDFYLYFLNFTVSVLQCIIRWAETSNFGNIITVSQ